MTMTCKRDSEQNYVCSVCTVKNLTNTDQAARLFSCLQKNVIEAVHFQQTCNKRVHLLYIPSTKQFKITTDKTFMELTITITIY